MIKISTRIGKFMEREEKAVEETIELGHAWGEKPSDYKVARRLLTDLAELDEEMTNIIKDSPVTALQNAPFGWGCYEVRNAQINLVFLIQFGVNHAQSSPSIYDRIGAKPHSPDLTEEEFAALSNCVGLVQSRIAPNYETYGGIEVLVVGSTAEKALDKIQRWSGLTGELAETRVIDEADEGGK